MRNAAETRGRLLETATRLIWQSNYSSVGVNEICKQAGVTKGAFYHHFDSKADLFVEASRYYWDEIKIRLDTIFSPSFTPLEQLENLIQFVVEKQEDEGLEDGMEVSGCPFFTAGAQAGAQEPKIRMAVEEMTDRVHQYNVALMRGLKADGVLDGDADVDQLARFVLHYVQGLMIYGRVMNSLEAIRVDLRQGMYQLIDLKPEYRLTEEEAEARAKAQAA